MCVNFFLLQMPIFVSNMHQWQACRKSVYATDVMKDVWKQTKKIVFLAYVVTLSFGFWSPKLISSSAFWDALPTDTWSKSSEAHKRYTKTVSQKNRHMDCLASHCLQLLVEAKIQNRPMVIEAIQRFATN